MDLSKGHCVIFCTWKACSAGLYIFWKGHCHETINYFVKQAGHDGPVTLT